jgi:hypothetical protein
MEKCSLLMGISVPEFRCWTLTNSQCGESLAAFRAYLLYRSAVLYLFISVALRPIAGHGPILEVF